MATLNGKVAVVTGGAGGLGRGFAAALANEGAAVAVADRNAEGAEVTAVELRRAGAKAISMYVDVTDEAQVTQMVEQTLSELGGLQILVNNAGIDDTAPVVEMPLSQWKRMIEHNLTSVFLCSKAALPTMIGQRWGRIINIGSQLGIKGTDSMAHYCAAKAGVHGFTRALAYEVASYNITVNAIAPGPIETDLLLALPEDWLARKKAEVPLGRFGKVEEITPVAVLLASEAGGYFTGSTINVSGGDVML